jgi:hypothetical protein
VVSEDSQATSSRKNFTRDDRGALMQRLTAHEPQLKLAA